MSIARSELKNEKFKGLLTGRKLAPVHPGLVLLEDFIEQFGIPCGNLDRHDNNAGVTVRSPSIEKATGWRGMVRQPEHTQNSRLSVEFRV